MNGQAQVLTNPQFDAHFPHSSAGPAQSDSSDLQRFDRDRAQLLAARSGDSRAGRYLMSRHRPGMVRAAWKVLGIYAASEAEDIVQEAFLSALTTPSLPQSNVAAWLRAITARRALDWLRRVGRRRELPLEASGGRSSARAKLPPTHHPGEKTILVRQALSKLSVLNREILTRVDLFGQSSLEVAEALGISSAAVKLRSMRARRKLASLLGA